jgi:serine/threonine protein phosphatase PrpC
MKICASVVSHPGNCRKKNEDNFSFNKKMLTSSKTLWPLSLRTNTERVSLFGIFDGMGIRL